MENEYEVNSVSLEMMDRDAVEASAAESQSESSSLSNSLESGLTVESSRGDATDSKKLVNQTEFCSCYTFASSRILVAFEIRKRLRLLLIVCSYRFWSDKFELVRLDMEGSFRSDATIRFTLVNPKKKIFDFDDEIFN